jgi:DNA polymerase V
MIDGELTVKSLEKRWGKIRLIAENPAHAPIELRDGQELTIWGVVTRVIQRIKR